MSKGIYLEACNVYVMEYAGITEVVIQVCFWAWCFSVFSGVFSMRFSKDFVWKVIVRM